MLEVLIDDRFDRKEGEELQVIKQAMLKLRENNKELKKTNDYLNKGIEEMLFQNVLWQSMGAKEARLKALLKMVSKKFNKGEEAIDKGPVPRY